MRQHALHLRSLFNSTPHRLHYHPSRLTHLQTTLSSPSHFSSLSNQQTRYPQKALFKSDNKDSLITRLCREKKFKDAFDILCQQRRLTHLQTTLSSPSHFSSLSNQHTRYPQKALFKSDNKDSLITRLCREKKFKDVFDILCQQRRLKDAIRLLENEIDYPFAAIYSGLFQLCIEQRALEEGRKVHAHLKRSNFTPGVFISNRIIEFYCKCERPSEARQVFDEMGERDLCSWNIMISGYAKAGLIEDAKAGLIWQGLYVIKRENWDFTREKSTLPLLNQAPHRLLVGIRPEGLS